MKETHKQLINGEWVDASNKKSWDLINPATEEVITALPFGDGEDCKQAIMAASRAFPSWSTKTPYERAAILKAAAETIRKEADSLAKETVLESGKPLVEAKGEWTVAADLFEWFAEEGKRSYGRTIPSKRADKRMSVIFQPLGVVGIITAWNFPAYNPARAWGAALAAGCTVVARASEFTPLTAMNMAEILVRSGLPAGVLNLINGDPHPMGQEMLNSTHVRKISFTGSVRVGKLLMDGASRTVTRLGLELGGNAPVLVFPDVDIESVAKSAVISKFRNNGQVCISPQRFLVHQKIQDQFAEKVSKLVGALKIGSGLEPDTRVGPLINAKQRDHVSTLVSDAKSTGAQVLTGGKRPETLKRGYFFEPTVLAGVSAENRAFKDEIFGPVMPITSWDDVDQAIHLANQTEYGLMAYVWTNDLRAATRAYEKLEFGMVGVNDWAPHAVEAPFCGWKQSGLGAECGQEGLMEYMDRKLVGIGGLG